MEKDLKMLEELMEFLKRNDFEDFYGDATEEIQALENLIKEYRELKENFDYIDQEEHRLDMRNNELREEIKFEEIIRTENGKLYKIVSANEQDFLCIEMKENATSLILLSDLDIKTHSKNIIDLIEVGDYVNGFYIDELSQNPEHKLIWHLSRYGDDDEVFKQLKDDGIELEFIYK